MVLIHYKKTDKNQFLYETTVTIPIEELLPQLVERMRSFLTNTAYS